MVGHAGGVDGVDRDLDVAAGTVLEADGSGDSGGELAVNLALGGAGTDCSPGDEIRDELRADGVEEFGAGGHTDVEDVEEEFAGDAEAFVDVEGKVHAGVVDEPFPADGRAGFFEVDAHDENEVVGVSGGGLGEQGGVFEGGGGIVDRAGADDHEEAVVVAAEDGFGGAAALSDNTGLLSGDGELAHEPRRGR